MSDKDIGFAGPNINFLKIALNDRYKYSYCESKGERKTQVCGNYCEFFLT